MQRPALQAHGLHVTAGGFHRLLDGNRNLARLAVAEADLAFAVTNDGKCGETELAATLDNLGYTVDRDQLFQQSVTLCL
jgi:hypothetical protein